jgi:hypothetical protein
MMENENNMRLQKCSCAYICHGYLSAKRTSKEALVIHKNRDYYFCIT